VKDLWAKKKKRYASSSRWRKEHPEEAKLYSKKWAETHREQTRKTAREFAERNREKIREYSRKRSYTTSGIYSVLKRKVGGKGNFITKEDFTGWFDNERKVCYYCGISEKEMLQDVSSNMGSKDTRLTIDRMDNLHTYTVGNLVFACRRCNAIKGNHFTASEMLEIARLFITPKNKKDFS
jgi:hypothetical protein